MMVLVFVLVLAIAIAVGLALLKGKAFADSASAVGFPYLATPQLFSAAERSFLGVLDQAAAPEFRVFGKVRVADVASIKPGMTKQARQGALNRISGKHFDFLLCRSSDLAAVCAIELDDKSHGSQKAQKRDEFLSELCRTIGLPLLRVPAKAGYQVAELRAQLLTAIEPTTASNQATSVAQPT